MNVIQMLFPKTDRIKSYSKWTTKDSIEEINSEKFKQKIQQKREMLEDVSFKACKAKFDKAKYDNNIRRACTSVQLYNQSAKHGDETLLLANRSLCWMVVEC